MSANRDFHKGMRLQPFLEPVNFCFLLPHLIRGGLFIIKHSDQLILCSDQVGPDQIEKEMI